MRLPILFYILPLFIVKDLCIISDKSSCCLFITLQFPEHPSGHVTVGALLHIAMLGANTTATELGKFIGHGIVDFNQ